MAASATTTRNTAPRRPRNLCALTVIPPRTPRPPGGGHHCTCSAAVRRLAQKTGLYAYLGGESHAAGEENPDAVLDRDVGEQRARALTDDDVAEVEVICRQEDRQQRLGTAPAIHDELAGDEPEHEAA